jgi:hypothetical protein
MFVYLETSTRSLGQRPKIIPATYSTSCVEYQFAAGKFTKTPCRLFLRTTNPRFRADSPPVVHYGGDRPFSVADIKSRECTSRPSACGQHTL